MERRLAAFLVVARTGRLSEAARRLNLPVSSVSQQIGSLEVDFGVRLFVRSNRGMALSSAGEALRRHAEEIEATWRQAFREVRRAESGVQAVHLAASQTVTEIFLPEPLGRFRRHEPTVQLTLTMANSAGVLLQVETGQVDFGIVEGRLHTRGLNVSPLWQDELGLVVSTRHPWAGRSEVGVDELAEADLILREEGSGTRRVLESALHHVGRDLGDFRVIMELSSLRAITAMVSHNVGVSVLSRRVATDSAGAPSAVVFVAIAGLRLRREIDLVTRDGDELSAASRRLVALLERSAHGASGHAPM